MSEAGQDAGTGPTPEQLDTVLARLTAGAEDSAQSRLLDPLIGDWQTESVWEPFVGHGLRRSKQRTENRWILGGRTLESRTFDDAGEEQLRLLLSFDPSSAYYAAYAVHTLSTFFTLERGTWNDETRSLVLDGSEPVPGGRPPIRYQRSIHVLSDDEHAVSIGYPDVAPGTYGPMFTTHHRERR